MKNKPSLKLRLAKQTNSELRIDLNFCIQNSSVRYSEFLSPL